MIRKAGRNHEGENPQGCPLSVPERAEEGSGDCSPLHFAARHNYVAFFLTLACNLRCPYCINRHGRNRGSEEGYPHLSGEEWVRAANRLVLRDDLPLTLQGGEPTLHRDFYRIVNEVNPAIKMDLLTNLSFEVEEFIANVPPWRFNRPAPYAPIRVSYHPGQNDLAELKRKSARLMEAGFRIGIYGIAHPGRGKAAHIEAVKRECLREGFDFRSKEFLGKWKGSLYGVYRYEGAVNGLLRDCRCKPSELLVAPDGRVYRCHADLYNRREAIGDIADGDFTPAFLDGFRPCSMFGACNPCDVKVKTNRFQQFGHTSCEIRFD